METESSGSARAGNFRLWWFLSKGRTCGISILVRQGQFFLHLNLYSCSSQQRQQSHQSAGYQLCPGVRLDTGYNFFPSRKSCSKHRSVKEKLPFGLSKSLFWDKMGLRWKLFSVLLCDLVKSAGNLLVSDVSSHYRLAVPNRFSVLFFSKLSSGSEAFCPQSQYLLPPQDSRFIWGLLNYKSSEYFRNITYSLIYKKRLSLFNKNEKKWGSL